VEILFTKISTDIVRVTNRLYCIVYCIVTGLVDSSRDGL